MDKKEINKNSAEYQAGVSAGAHRMADYLIRELDDKVSEDILALIESKKWEFVEQLFENEMDAVLDSF